MTQPLAQQMAINIPMLVKFEDHELNFISSAKVERVHNGYHAIARQQR